MQQDWTRNYRWWWGGLCKEVVTLEAVVYCNFVNERCRFAARCCKVLQGAVRCCTFVNECTDAALVAPQWLRNCNLPQPNYILGTNPHQYLTTPYNYIDIVGYTFTSRCSESTYILLLHHHKPVKLLAEAVPHAFLRLFFFGPFSNSHN